MSDSKERKVSLEQYEKIIHALSPCMDDYLYVYDLVNDVYCISPTAVERFRLPASRFTNVNEHLKELTHPDDWYTLSHDISKIFSDANYSFHNLQYRWTNRMGEEMRMVIQLLWGAVLMKSERNSAPITSADSEVKPF